MISIYLGIDTRRMITKRTPHFLDEKDHQNFTIHYQIYFNFKCSDQAENGKGKRERRDLARNKPYIEVQTVSLDILIVFKNLYFHHYIR